MIRLFMIGLATMIFLFGWLGLGFSGFPTWVASLDIAAAVFVSLLVLALRGKNSDYFICGFVSLLGLSIIQGANADGLDSAVFRVVQGSLGGGWLILGVALAWPAAARLLEGPDELRPSGIVFPNLYAEEGDRGR